MKSLSKNMLQMGICFSLLINVSCSISDDIMVSENALPSIYIDDYQSDSIEVSAKDKIFYALSIMKRIEHQIIFEPTRKTIDFERFNFSYKMFLNSYTTEPISSNKVVVACSVDDFYNGFLDLGDNIVKYRKKFICDYLMMLLEADKNRIPNVLENYFKTYEKFLSDNKINVQLFQKKEMTRSTGVEYKVSLITPVGEYQISCGNDEYILDAAEENGIDLPSSCRCGYDIAAAAKLVKGQVDLSENYCLSEEEKNRGYCLIDVSKPLSDCVIYTHKESELLIEHELPEIEVLGNSDDDDDNDSFNQMDDVNWDEFYNSIPEPEPTANGSSGGGTDYKDRSKKFMAKFNDVEKELAKKHPVEAVQVALNAISAEDLADYYYNDNGVHNGLNDAFRHMIWSAYNSYDIGYDLAKEFVDAHEMNPNQPQNERQMDEFNNYLGLNIGIYARNNGYGKSDIAGLVLQNIGNAKTL